MEDANDTLTIPCKKVLLCLMCDSVVIRLLDESESGGGWAYLVSWRRRKWGKETS